MPHKCANSHCKRRVQDKLFACKRCWIRLPAIYRNGISRAYTIGQEEDLSLISEEWQDAVALAREHWNDRAGAIEDDDEPTCAS